MSAQFRNLCTFIGIDPWRTVKTLRGLPRLARDWRRYNALNDTGRFPAEISKAYPVTENFETEAGTVRGDYFHQDLWAARKIYERRPERHVDVGSRIDGFIAHLLTFMPVEVIDVRPLASDVSGLTFSCEDATTMARFPDNSLNSLSTLHAVEHFGLGRFGDQINPHGSFQAMKAFSRVLAPGGRLYFSVPIGVEVMRFNAHRIFSPSTIVDAFRDLTLVSFAAVNPKGHFVPVATVADFTTVRQALGLFEFTKN